MTLIDLLLDAGQFSLAGMLVVFACGIALALIISLFENLP